MYYLTRELKQMVDNDFEFIQDIPWYTIFKDPKTDEYWRLTTPDKYQTDYMVKIPKDSNWENFDNQALNNIVYCASHAYTEMNIKE